MKLITRYDLYDITTKSNTRNIIALFAKGLSAKETKVLYINTEYGTRREQVKYYSLKEAIYNFEYKIKHGHPRFIEIWDKYLTILKSID